MCCNPFHSLTIYLHQPQTRQVLLTMDRPGCDGCGGPKPCLGLCACMDCCQDQINIFDGFAQGSPGTIQGEAISRIVQPPGGGGCCHPLLVVDPNGEDGKGGGPSGFVEGPAIFGGCSELCVESRGAASERLYVSADSRGRRLLSGEQRRLFGRRYFTYSSQQNRSGDIAVITKLTPRDCGSVCAEMCTDVDRYKITFKPGATAEQKADAIGALMLSERAPASSNRASSPSLLRRRLGASPRLRSRRLGFVGAPPRRSTKTRRGRSGSSPRRAPRPARRLRAGTCSSSKTWACCGASGPTTAAI